MWSLCGCSSGDSLHVVRGRVEFADGTPVTFGMVEFSAVNGRHTCRAAIQTDGSFVIGKDGKGAVAGDHRVIVVQSQVGGMPLGEHAKHLAMVDRRYSRFETSGLTIHVMESEETADVVLQVARARK